MAWLTGIPISEALITESGVKWSLLVINQVNQEYERIIEFVSKVCMRFDRYIYNEAAREQCFRDHRAMQALGSISNLGHSELPAERVLPTIRHVFAFHEQVYKPTLRETRELPNSNIVDAAIYAVLLPNTFDRIADVMAEMRI